MRGSWSYRAPAANEAQALLRLIQRGTATIEEVRELIQVSAAEEKLLTSAGFPAALSFRRRVLVEFDRMVATARAPIASEPSDDERGKHGAY